MLPFLSELGDGVTSICCGCDSVSFIKTTSATASLTLEKKKKQD